MEHAEYFPRAGELAVSCNAEYPVYGFWARYVATRIGLSSLGFLLLVDDHRHVRAVPSGMFEMVDDSLDHRWIADTEPPRELNMAFCLGFPQFVQDPTHQSGLLEGKPEEVAAFRSYTGEALG